VLLGHCDDADANDNAIGSDNVKQESSQKQQSANPSILTRCLKIAISPAGLLSCLYETIL